MTEEIDEKTQKLIELDQKYSEKLSKLRDRAFNLVNDYTKKADEHKAQKILQKLKGENGA